MKLNIFKQIDYKPKEITALCSTDTHIYIFRSNKSCEIIDSVTLQSISYINTGYVIIKSLIYKNSIICISELDELLWINIKNFSIETNKIGYKILDFILYGDKILLTTFNGFIIELKEKELNIKYKTSVLLSCIVQYDDVFLVGAQNKILIFDNNFKLKNEIEIQEGLIKKITYFKDKKFGLVTDTGYFIFLDISLLNIIQKILIRNSSLNVLLYNSDTFYTSGEDSRLICYKLINNIFVKGYQIDLHYGISNCILLDHKRIFVGNSDGMLSILIPCKDKFTYTKIYDRSVCASTSKDLLLVNNRTHLDLFNLKEENVKLKNKSNKNEKNQLSNLCTFKLLKNIKEDFSVKNVPFSNLLRIYSDFISFSIICDSNIIYSDSKGTNLIELEKSNVNKIDLPDLENFRSVNIRTDNNVILLKDFTGSYKFISKDNYMNVNYEIKNEEHNNELLISKDGPYKLVQVKSYDINKSYIFYINDKIKKKVTTLDIIIDIFTFQNELWYFTQTYIYNIDRNKKFEFDAVIYDVKVVNDRIVVVKDDWKYIQKYIKQGIFKKKYSTK